MAFDKQRAIRILGDTHETYEEMLKDHSSSGEYTHVNQMLEMHAELEADRDTVSGLKDYLETEYDCD